MSFSEKHIRNAFDMVLGIVEYGNYTYLGVDVLMRGQSSGVLTVKLRPAAASSEQLVNDLIQIKTNLKRTCFDFYTKTGVLLTPKAVAMEAQAAE